MIPRCAVLFVVPGRLMSKRRSGQKLVFYDLEGQGGHLQLMALANKHQPTPGSRLSLSLSFSLCFLPFLTILELIFVGVGFSSGGKLSDEEEFRFVHHDLLRRGDLVGT
jgi:hypothetical protein